MKNLRLSIENNNVKGLNIFKSLLYYEVTGYKIS